MWFFEETKQQNQIDNKDDENFSVQKLSDKVYSGLINLHIISRKKILNINNHKGDVLRTQTQQPIPQRVLSSDLPTSIIMKIFSYLDVISLCRVSQTCHTWNNIANDDLLWKKKLKQDSQRWEVIDHLTHPSLHIEINPEIHYKEVYLKCCPECKLRRINSTYKRQIPNLSFYFGFSIPKVVMFGSGLNNSGFVKSLLWDKKSPFTVQEMFPGQFEGTGSGFKLLHSGGSMNLITLYGRTKLERRSNNVNQKSRLLVEGGEGEGHDSMTLSPPIRELCSTIDAFVYVVNSSDREKVLLGTDEFKAMLDPRWVKNTVPLLVLCLVEDGSVKSVPSIDVSNELNMLNLSRPWLVRQCHVNTLYGVQPGVNWLSQRIMSY